MTKKEYIEKIENLIFQRIKYHAPNVNKEEIDYALLEAIGINANLPIFIFKKPLNKVFFKAFENAKKKAKFNLILFERPLFDAKKLEKLENTYLIYKEEIGGNLFNTLEGLNINYLTRSKFENNLEGEYIKINKQKIIFDYLPYFLNKKMMQDGVIYNVKQFLLNGKNFIINIVNTKKFNQKIKLEINIPLPRGYYVFKKGVNCIEIQNLTNKEKAYFNYNLRGTKFSFSNMSGIESCTFACVNMTCEVEVSAQTKKDIYFNFGENKQCIFGSKNMEYFFELSQQKFNEIFDMKVQTRDVEFDNTFNLYLPRKIWEKWQNFDIDEESINNWLKIRSEIVKSSAKGLQISSKLKGLKEVKFYRNLRWKRVFVLHNNSNYMYANKVKYFNYDLLTKDIFEKNNEIYLSFAD